MDIQRKIKAARNLTPTEQQLAQTLLAMGQRLGTMSIQEFALASSASIASVHRFCKKLGLEGFKELKVEVARSLAENRGHESVDINFPFSEGDGAETVAARLELLYETTLRETRELMDASELARAAQLVKDAAHVDVYTQSHNLYPAQMFCDRLLSAGKNARCDADMERQIRCALASDESHVAIAISYSGLAQNVRGLLPMLTEKGTPVILIGTPHATALHPGLACYLRISDSESLQGRITQFASHVSVQYALDALYGSFFALDYQRSLAFLEASLPYTRLPGIDSNSN